MEMVSRSLMHGLLLGMRDDPAAAAILQHARSQGFEPATEADYDAVRHIYKAIGQ